MRIEFPRLGIEYIQTEFDDGNPYAEIKTIGKRFISESFDLRVLARQLEEIADALDAERPIK